MRPASPSEFEALFDDPSEEADEGPPIEVGRGSLADSPWPGPVPGVELIDVVAVLRAERGDR